MSIEHDCAVHICFVDLKKAYESVPRDVLRLLLKDKGIEKQVVQLIVDIHNGTHCVVKSSGNNSSNLKLQLVYVRAVLFLLYYLISSWTRLYAKH